MPSSWSTTLSLDPSITILATFLIILCCTRFVTGREFRSALLPSVSPKAPATAPYVTPFFGQYVTLCYVDPFRWMKKLRCNVPYQPFAAQIWGTKFNVVADRKLQDVIFNDHTSNLSFASIRWYLAINIFGANSRHEKAFLAAQEDAHFCLKGGHKGDSGLSSTIQRIVKGLQECAPNLVSFSQSMVDENSWERPANPRITSSNEDVGGTASTVEVDFFALVRNFLSHITIPSLVGTDFLEVNPKFVEHLWDFDCGWRYLVMGLPRWLPIRGLPKAYIARRELYYAMTSFHRDIDSTAIGEEHGNEWGDLEEVSQLLKDRSSAWRKHKTPPDVRASADLSLLWASNVKSSSLVFWMLLHIFSSPGLVGKIRQEIIPYVTATQPPNAFNIPEPPRLKIQDLDGLVRSCPILKACFYECLRLYSSPVSVRKVTKTFTVTGTSTDQSSDLLRQPFAFQAGTFVVAPLGLHTGDASVFASPRLFKPDRFLTEGQDGKQKCASGALRPWGLGEAVCPGRQLAEKQVLAFVAGITSLWDIKPMGLKGCESKDHALHSVVAAPIKDTRVLIRARELSLERSRSYCEGRD